MAGVKRGCLCVVSRAVSGITRILIARSSRMLNLPSDYQLLLANRSLTNVNLVKCKVTGLWSPLVIRRVLRKPFPHLHRLKSKQIQCEMFHLLQPRRRLLKACFWSCALVQLCYQNVFTSRVSLLCQLTISRTVFILFPRFAICL